MKAVLFGGPADGMLVPGDSQTFTYVVKEYRRCGCGHLQLREVERHRYVRTQSTDRRGRPVVEWICRLTTRAVEGGAA